MGKEHMNVDMNGNRTHFAGCTPEEAEEAFDLWPGDSVILPSGNYVMASDGSGLMLIMAAAKAG